MILYNIEENYIDYLRAFDNKIQLNKENRPYVGILFTINGFDYYAPLSSPKKKHRKMKNDMDFRKIAGGKYGAINFNNMIPVNILDVSKIDINNLQDVKYRRLLQNQVVFLKADWQNIIRVARKLYYLITQDNDNLSRKELDIKNRCCDFILLEKACKEYQR